MILQSCPYYSFIQFAQVLVLLARHIVSSSLGALLLQLPGQPFLFIYEAFTAVMELSVSRLIYKPAVGHLLMSCH